MGLNYQNFLESEKSEKWKSVILNWNTKSAQKVIAADFAQLSLEHKYTQNIEKQMNKIIKTYLFCTPWKVELKLYQKTEN